MAPFINSNTRMVLLTYTGGSLSAALEELEKTRKTAKCELEVVRNRKGHLERLERDRDELLDSLTGAAQAALDSLVSDDRRQLYKTLKLGVVATLDGSIRINGR